MSASAAAAAAFAAREAELDAALEAAGPFPGGDDDAPRDGAGRDGEGRERRAPGGGLLLPFRGIWPRVHPDAFVAPTAVLVGDVELGEGASVWYGCVLRGDTARIAVGARSNIQDGTVVHLNAGEPTTIGADVTVGHACIVHACTLEDRAFVGMGATVLDGAVVEGGGMLGAGALLTPGKRVRSGELWLGSPAKFARPMTPEDAARFARTAPHYVALSRAHRESLG